ncbi:MAG: hypothetical protein KKF48_03615 [Nanoarchaeota archaeon]|nr:hypothetical protein [Nanoarchaeota archaeon]MBU1028107.1 hypothetical protein [Nanoarchaeota archaeon]
MKEIIKNGIFGVIALAIIAIILLNIFFLTRDCVAIGTPLGECVGFKNFLGSVVIINLIVFLYPLKIFISNIADANIFLIIIASIFWIIIFFGLGVLMGALTKNLKKKEELKEITPNANTTNKPKIL